MKKVIWMLLLVGSLSACTPKQTEVFYVAEQYGTAYAPIALMRVQGTLQDELDSLGVSVSWSQLNNTAAIREAMLVGTADVGCMAIPPFLIGKEGGMEWKILGGVSSMPMGLTTRDPAVKSLSDITAQDRIALPQPGSIQHILLSMAAQRQLGQADLFDRQLVTMSHPDGMTALLSGTEVTLHFTTAPYLGQELAAGMQLVLDGDEAMGVPFTGIVAVGRDALYEEHPEWYEAFMRVLQASINQINEDPYGVATLLADSYGMTAEALYAELTADRAEYSTTVEGVDTFQEFMIDTGLLTGRRPLSELIQAGADA